MADPTNADIRELFDQLAVRDLTARYCRGVDRLDRDLMRSAFFADAMERHGAWFEGRAWDFVDFVLRMAHEDAFGAPCVHLATTDIVELDGDMACSETYVFSLNRLQRDEATYDYLFSGRFLSRCERRDGEWRIAERTLVHDVSRLDPVQSEALPSWPSIPRDLESHRSRRDPSYAFFENKRLPMSAGLRTDHAKRSDSKP